MKNRNNENDELEEPREIEENTFDDRLEVLKFSASVQSRIKDDVTADFTLARLNEKDRKFIVEMTQNVYIAKRMYLIILLQMQRKWEKKETYTQEEKHLYDKEYAAVTNAMKMNFDAFMSKIYMLAITNRNVDANYLINAITGYIQEAEKKENKKTGLLDRIKKGISPEEGDEDE